MNEPASLQSALTLPVVQHLISPIFLEKTRECRQSVVRPPVRPYLESYCCFIIVRCSFLPVPTPPSCSPLRFGSYHIYLFTMSSEKQDPNALAPVDQQLASMSLDDAAAAARPRTDNEGAGGAGDIDDEMFCSNCGKTGDDLKGCNSCRCIRYCSAKCQKKHWKHHKADCKRIKKALSDETRTEDRCVDLTEARPDSSGLFDDPPPPPDCALCMLPMPWVEGMIVNAPCCGTITCNACDFEAQIAKGAVNKKRAQKRQPPLPHCCEFCRAPAPIGASESELASFVLKAITARAEKNYPDAVHELALMHKKGLAGLPVNEEKALELAKRAADLGCAEAQYALGLSYERGELGLEVDNEKTRNLWGSSARNGHVKARYALGRDEFSEGNMIDAVRHWRIAAASGYGRAVDALIAFFEGGALRHKDLAKSLRARDKACLDMRSDSRDRYLARFKEP